MIPQAEFHPSIRDGGAAQDQHVVLHHVPWEQYDALCIAMNDCAGPRMTYLDGELEIMSPGSLHEHWKTLIARLVEAYGDEHELPLIGLGSTTYRQKPKQAGLEPDECYCVGEMKEFPDLAIEVVVTHEYLDKLEVYRRLGVREVWYWIDDHFLIYRLVKSEYRKVRRSEVLRGLDLVALAKLVVSTPPSEQPHAVRRFRQSLRDGNAGEKSRPNGKRRPAR